MVSATILMTTYNGEKFLVDQLDSLFAQTFKNWRLIVSDDGSTDKTLSILIKYQNLFGSDKITIRNGPKRGFAQNFLSLACDPNISSNYYAFCDQDDVWMPEKLSVAIKHIESENTNHGVYVYCGRTIYTDKQLNFIGYSPLFNLPLSFRNALIQSIAGGNTMVFNHATKILFENTGILPVVSHDWWLYQLVSGTGGVIFYDSMPYIFYRQHINAVIGGNQFLHSFFIRFYKFLNGTFYFWISINIQCLKTLSVYLTPNNIEILNLFAEMRSSNLKIRLRTFEVCGLYRQKWIDKFIFFIFLIFKKV